jgi:hypothetical protein
MVEIYYNPPDARVKDYFMNNFSLVDTRDRLTAQYSSRDGYPGYALGVGVIRVPVSLYVSDEGTPLSLDKDRLVEVVKAVRKLYDGQKASPAHISHLAQSAEIFGEGASSMHFRIICKTANIHSYDPF